MAFRPLDAREWLESQRIAGCEFAPELLDMVADEPDMAEAVNVLADIVEEMPTTEARELLEKREFWRTAEKVIERLHLLESLEEIIAEFSEGFTCANGTRPVDPDDLLRAMLESDRWQKYDL